MLITFTCIRPFIILISGENYMQLVKSLRFVFDPMAPLKNDFLRLIRNVTEIVILFCKDTETII